MIAIVSISVLLVVWSLWVRAPLEQPANPALTPNPAKAPWYFIGLQELLVYSDAWLVGVLVPCAAVLGLMAIPYLDFNPQGSGYYTIRERRFATAVFLFGFLMLWIVPILTGVFLRGPNWSAFGPYEVRDPGKLSATCNVTLAQWFWTSLLGRQLLQVPAHGLCGRLAAIAGRESRPDAPGGLFSRAAAAVGSHAAGRLPPPPGPHALSADDPVAAAGGGAAVEDVATLELWFELPGEHPGMVAEFLIPPPLPPGEGRGEGVVEKTRVAPIAKLSGPPAGKMTPYRQFEKVQSLLNASLACPPTSPLFTT